MSCRGHDTDWHLLNVETVPFQFEIKTDKLKEGGKIPLVVPK